MSAANIDARARAAREAFELAVVRKDAPATLVAGEEMLAVTQADPDYRLLALLPRTLPANSNARSGDDGPREVSAQWDGACTKCRAPVRVGDTAWWRPNVKGVQCSRCGGGR